MFGSITLISPLTLKPFRQVQAAEPDACPKTSTHRERAAIGGEALSATFSPASCPPTNNATRKAAASKLPPITAKKPMLDLWCAFSGSCRTTTQAWEAFLVAASAGAAFSSDRRHIEIPEGEQY
jgi:hypothetical protein